MTSLLVASRRRSSRRHESLLCLAVTLAALVQVVSGFAVVVSPVSSSRITTTTELAAVKGDSSSNGSRRALFGTCLTALTTAAVTAATSPQAAHASYSAYTHREEDWEARNKSNNVQYSTAKSLKAQLREIAPMNNEGSKLFCPNGPSAAVSPLMENKCSDERMALFPSVYGRTQDVVGNSIPGFDKTAGTKYYPSSSSVVSAGGGGGRAAAESNAVTQVGGFPKYK